MADLSCKLLVIGGGPGGYVCAIRAGQLGVDTVLVERESLGGTCLNIGCIPSKALIHAADEFARLSGAMEGHSPLGITATGAQIDLKTTLGWKDGIVSRLTNGVAALLKKAGVKVITGQARFVDGKTVDVETGGTMQRIHAETVVIATGSAPVELPFLPFGGPVISSAGALSLPDVPRNLVIVGGGYIGLEIGTALRKLGAAVTVVESAGRVLSHYDAELTAPVAARLKALGIEVLTDANAKGLSDDGLKLIAVTNAGKEWHLPADVVLVAVGRKPATIGWGLERLQLDMAGAFIRINDACRTSMRGIYAIGDVTGEPMLAHRAMAQGEMVAERVASSKRAWDKIAVPAICFTDPEVVVVGLSPEQAIVSGIEVRTGKFPLRANGRAMTLERDDGFIRVVASADTHVILGIQAVGSGIAELAGAFSLAIEMGARLEDVAATIHAHPSLGEALQEAALGALGHAIHM